MALCLGRLQGLGSSAQKKQTDHGVTVVARRLGLGGW